MQEATPATSALRRLAALGTIAALTLGTLSLAGCGDDEELPASTQQEAPMEEPAQDPAQDQDPAMADPMESQEPMPDEGTAPDEEEPGGY